MVKDHKVLEQEKETPAHIPAQLLELEQMQAKRLKIKEAIIQNWKERAEVRKRELEEEKERQKRVIEEENERQKRVIEEEKERQKRTIEEEEEMVIGWLDWDKTSATN
jgi:hypothetical protein